MPVLLLNPVPTCIGWYKMCLAVRWEYVVLTHLRIRASTGVWIHSICVCITCECPGPVPGILLYSCSQVKEQNASLFTVCCMYIHVHVCRVNGSFGW